MFNTRGTLMQSGVSCVRHVLSVQHDDADDALQEPRALPGSPEQTKCESSLVAATRARHGV